MSFGGSVYNTHSSCSVCRERRPKLLGGVNKPSKNGLTFKWVCQRCLDHQAQKLENEAERLLALFR